MTQGLYCVESFQKLKPLNNTMSTLRVDDRSEQEITDPELYEIYIEISGRNHYVPPGGFEFIDAYQKYDRLKCEVR